MRTAILLSVLLCLASMGLGQQRIPSKPVSEDDVIRVDTNLVTLPVKVSDHERIVFGLRREQFQVFENGIEQEIAYFESPDNSLGEPNNRALTIALMLDVSDSTEFKLKNIKNAALTFVDLLHAEDRVMVVVFDKDVQMLVESTSDRYVVRRAINALHMGGGTSLYEALNEVIGKRLARVSGRKAIVLLTDGVDTTSESITFDSVIRVAETSDVTIYPVQYHTYADFTDNASMPPFAVLVTRKGEYLSEAYKRATRFLRLLAEKTAGDFHFADNSKNLAKSFDTIARQLREHYTLGYYPKDRTDGARKIEIRVRENPKLTVRTRRSYVYKNSR